MKITKSQLKQIIVEEIGKLQKKNDEDLYKSFLKLEMFGTASAEADKAGNCAAKGGTWDEEQGKCVFGEKNDPDKTPYMDMTKYELDDLSTDRQMVVLLKEVVAQLKVLNQHITPAKSLGASTWEKDVASSAVAEGKSHPGPCAEAPPDQSHEEWEA